MEVSNHAPASSYSSPLIHFDLLLGPGRCFPFWQEVLACYVVNNSPEDGSGQRKCAPVIEDYYECLYHKKEVYDDLSDIISQSWNVESMVG